MACENPEFRDPLVCLKGGGGGKRPPWLAKTRSSATRWLPKGWRGRGRPVTEVVAATNSRGVAALSRTLRDLLISYRERASSEREKGDLFRAAGPHLAAACADPEGPVLAGVVLSPIGQPKTASTSATPVSTLSPSLQIAPMTGARSSASSTAWPPHPEGRHRQLLHGVGQAPLHAPPDRGHDRGAVE